MRLLKAKISRALKVQKALFPQNYVNDSDEETEATTPSHSEISDPEPRVANCKNIPITKDITQSKGNVKGKANSRPKGSKIVEEKLDNSKKRRYCTKNIVTNYGKAISSFALSHLALPYLQPRLDKSIITSGEFYNFILKGREAIKSIQTFRTLLFIEEGDDAKYAECKRVFQYICEVFIKYFSVNWIIHGKMDYKLIYLKYRFKMLRRVRDPENFTYLRERVERF